MIRSTPILAALLFGALVLPAQAGPQGARGASVAQRSPLSAFSPLQRQAIVLLTGGRLEQRLGGLPKNSPKQAVDTLKIVSIAYQGMSALSAQAGWPEMARYYTETSTVFARMARGELKREAVDKATLALENRRRSLTQSTIKRLQTSGISPADPQLAGIATQLATQIDSRARAAVTGGTRKAR